MARQRGTRERETLKQVEPEVDVGDHGRATVNLLPVTIREQVTVTKDGKRIEGELESPLLGTGFGRASVSMTDKDLVVTWE